MAADPKYEPFLDPLALARLRFEHSELWQLDLLDAGRFAQYATEMGIDFQRSQIEILWQFGMLRADLIQSKSALEFEYLLEVESSGNGSHTYVGGPALVKPKDGWIADFESIPVLPEGVTLFFHPFRLYPLYAIRRVLATPGVSPFYAIVSRESYIKLVDLQLSLTHHWIGSPDFPVLVSYWNSIADLAIAMEPQHYVEVTEVVRHAPHVTLEQHSERVAVLSSDLRRRLVHFDLSRVEEARRALCLDAERLESNRRLHTLVRLMNPDERQRLRGPFAGAILFLAMAEIIRRAAEGIFERDLPEEGEMGFGLNTPALKSRLYGSTRILDDEAAAKRYLQSFGLHYSLKVRWYLEGPTECGAVETCLRDVPQIKYVNLSGEVAQKQGKGLSFSDNLANDTRLEVFSFVLIDGDRRDNVRVLEKAAKDDRFCGMFDVATPDFEFHNFTRSELGEILWGIAAEYDAPLELQAQLIQGIATTGNGNELLSAARRALPEYLGQLRKGKYWGIRLSEYALAHPLIKNDVGEAFRHRPYLDLVYEASRAIRMDYALSRANYQVDPVSGRVIRRTTNNVDPRH